MKRMLEVITQAKEKINNPAIAGFFYNANQKESRTAKRHGTGFQLRVVILVIEKMTLVKVVD